MLLGQPELKACVCFPNILSLHVTSDFEDIQRVNQVGGLDTGPHLNLIHSTWRFSNTKCFSNSFLSPLHAPVLHADKCVSLPGKPQRTDTVSPHGPLSAAVCPGIPSSETWPKQVLKEIARWSSRWFDQGGQQGRELQGKPPGHVRLIVCWDRSPRGKIGMFLGVEGGSGLWLCLHAQRSEVWGLGGTESRTGAGDQGPDAGVREWKGVFNTGVPDQEGGLRVKSP